jgi:protein TonB
MFEDSTFESFSRIHTGSRNWMIAAFAFNSTIVAALILIPLLNPQVLPRQMITYLMETPLPPHAQQQPQPQPAHAAPAAPNTLDNPFQAPRRIPSSIIIPDKPESLPNIVMTDPGTDTGIRDSTAPAFPARAVRPNVRPEHTGPVRVPSSAVEALLLLKTIPTYPAIAIASRTEGTVSLEATISKAGTIENLRVVSGPAMLQLAALNAVRTWRYRPYLLDGQPVEVETTVNVIFTLNR